MTAVASPPSYPAGLAPRNGWPTSGSNNGTTNVNGSAINLNAMSQDDVTRMFVPRKSAQRTNSSSSLSSNASTASTSTINSSVGPPSTNGDIPLRRSSKPIKGLWPSSAKSEPVSGITTTRPTSVSSSASGPSAASAISALHTPQSSSNQMAQTNGISRGPMPGESPAILNLMPLNGTFERKTITVPYTPEVLRIGRQTNAKTVPTPINGYFDSKVLSRQHAEVWAERDGKIFIRDVKSSNGTFVNGKRLSQENRDSEPHPLKDNDILELGIDIISEDQKTVVHHKVAAKVEHAGLMGIVAPPQEMDADAFNPMRARAGTNANRSQQNLSAAAYHAKWLQPITLEHIAKKLKTELRQAKLQNQDLVSTSAFVNAIASNKTPPALPLPKIASPARSVDLKARFSSEPPAPPPSQPLPEKPDVPAKIRFQDLPAIQPLLRRSDTEKPRLFNGSPISPEAAPSISSLFNALSIAKDEINAQTERMRLLEESLQQEREARQYAEARAKLAAGDVNVPRAEQAFQHGDEDEQTSPSGRIELMRMEIEQMKMQMETYRQRAETAESQNETLAEMIEKIKKENEGKKHSGSWSLRKSKIKTPPSDAMASPEEDASATRDGDDAADDGLEDEVDQLLKHHLTRQRTLKADGTGETSGSLTDAQIKSASTAVSRALRVRNPGALAQRSRQEQLAQTAPYASILGVVLIGVGLMTYLNGWQKVSDR